MFTASEIVDSLVRTSKEKPRVLTKLPNTTKISPTAVFSEVTTPQLEQKALWSKIMKICKARWTPSEARTDEEILYDMYIMADQKLKRSASPKILIVMDNRFVAAAIAIMLKQCNCTVFLCCDGAKAYTKYFKNRKFEFNLCICDWESPGKIGGRDLYIYERENGGNMPFMTQVPKGVSANDYRRTGADFVFRKPLCVHISAIKELILPYHDVYVYPEKLLKTPSNHTELADILLSICKNSNLDLQLFHVDSDEDNEEDDLFEKGVKLLERIMNMLRSQRANGLEVVGDGTLEAMRSKYNNMGRAFRASIETFNNMMSDIVSKTNELRLLREYKRKKEGGILKGGIESYSLEASNSIRFCTGDSTDSRNTLTNDVAGEKRDATGSPNITTGSGALSHSEVSGFGKSVGLCGSLSLKEDANEYQPNNNNNNTTDIIITEDYLAAIHEPGTFNALGNFNVENMTTSEMSLLIRNFKCRVIDLQNENELLVKDMKRFTDYSVGFENAMTDNNICVKFGTSVLRGSSISLNDDESEGSTTEEGKTSAKIIEGETVSLDNILPIISYIKRDNKNNSSFKHSSGVAHVRGGLYMNYEEYSRRLECSIMAREDTFGKAPLKSLHRDSLNKEKDTVTPISVSFRPISRQTHDNKNPMQKFNDTLYKMCNGVAKDINRAIAKLMATHPIHHLLLENLSQTLRQKLNKFDMDLYISEMDKYVESRVSLETKVLEDDLVRAKQTIKKIREQNVGLDTRKQLMALRQTVFVTQKRVSRILEAKVRQKITIVWYYKWRLAIAVKRKGGRSTISYDVNDTTSKNNAINELRYAKEEIAALTRTIEHGRKLAESKRNSFVKSTPSFDLKKNTSFSKTPRYDTSRVDEDIKTSNVTMNYTTNLDIKKSTAPRSQEDSISTPVSRYDTSRVDEDIKTSNVTMNYTTNLDIKKSTAQRSQEDSINTPVSRYDTSRVDEDIKTSNVTMKYITNLDSVSQDHDDIGNSDNIQSDMSPVKHGSSPTEETLKYETISLESPISDVSADVSKSVTRKAAIRKNDAALLTTNKQKVRNVGGNSASSKNRGNDAVRGKLDGKSLDKGESKQTFTNTKISQNLNPNSSRGSTGGKKVTKKVLSQKESATARDPHANGIIKRNLSSQQGELHSPDDAPQEELEVRPGSGSKEINITASHVTTSSQQFSDSIAGDAVHTICSSTSAIGVNPLIPGDSIEKGTCYQSTDVKGDSNSISLVSLVPMEGAEGQLSQELASNTDSRRDEETLDTTMMSEYSSSLFAVETNRTPLLESMRDYNSQTNITPATLVTVSDNDHVLLTSGNMVGCKTLLSPHAIPSVHVNSESDSIINNATSTADGYDNYLSYDVSVKKEKSCGTVHTSSEKSSSVSPFLSPPRSLRDTNSDSVGNSPTTNQTSPSHQFQPVYPVISPMVAALKSNMFRSSIPNTADDIRQYIGGSRSARGTFDSCGTEVNHLPTKNHDPHTMESQTLISYRELKPVNPKHPVTCDGVRHVEKYNSPIHHAVGVPIPSHGVINVTAPISASDHSQRSRLHCKVAKPVEFHFNSLQETEEPRNRLSRAVSRPVPASHNDYVSTEDNNMHQTTLPRISSSISSPIEIEYTSGAPHRTGGGYFVQLKESGEILREKETPKKSPHRGLIEKVEIKIENGSVIMPPPRCRLAREAECGVRRTMKLISHSIKRLTEARAPIPISLEKLRDIAALARGEMASQSDEGKPSILSLEQQWYYYQVLSEHQRSLHFAAVSASRDTAKVSAIPEPYCRPHFISPLTQFGPVIVRGGQPITNKRNQSTSLRTVSPFLGFDGPPVTDQTSQGVEPIHYSMLKLQTPLARGRFCPEWRRSRQIKLPPSLPRNVFREVPDDVQRPYSLPPINGSPMIYPFISTLKLHTPRAPLHPTHDCGKGYTGVKYNRFPDSPIWPSTVRNRPLKEESYIYTPANEETLPKIKVPLQPTVFKMLCSDIKRNNGRNTHDIPYTTRHDYNNNNNNNNNSTVSDLSRGRLEPLTGTSDKRLA